MGDPRSNVALKVIPVFLFGTVGAALLSNTIRNAYRTFVESDGQRARDIQARVDKPNVYLDLRSGSKPLGRVEIKLDYEDKPLTSENFRALCTGETGIEYRGSVFHRFVPGFLMQGGDIDRGDGTGGRSIYGTIVKNTFDDESFEGRKHTQPGAIGMANKGPNTNNSQFYIFTSEDPAPWLDGKHVVFGQVVKGMDVVYSVEAERAEPGPLRQKLLQKAETVRRKEAADMKAGEESTQQAQQRLIEQPGPMSPHPIMIYDCGEVPMVEAVQVEDS